MKWLVVWIWLNSIIIGCPSVEPVPDKFGRVPQVYTATLQVCYETVRERKEKLFDTKMEAEAFIEEGKKEPDLKDFEIKEINQ